MSLSKAPELDAWQKENEARIPTCPECHHKMPLRQYPHGDYFHCRRTKACRKNVPVTLLPKKEEK